jgi:DNA-binding NarL/FixJ family response regulator
MPAPLRIALVDDHEIFLESMVALIGNAGGDFEVVWCALSGEEALKKAREQTPDVVVLDYTFRGKAVGGDICEALKNDFPELNVLMLSVSEEVAVIRETLQKGARGYASKEIGKAELLRGIRAVAAGEYFLDQTALGKVVSWLTGGKSKQGCPLTEREMDVAKIYCKGLKIKEIAQALFISEDTVESHIKNIRSKTGAASRFEVDEFIRKHCLQER